MKISNEKLRELCIKNGWFGRGTNFQYDKLFYANKMGCSIDELATIIWLCTDCEELGTCRREIKLTLEEAMTAEFIW